jgi:hypothetical protein
MLQDFERRKISTRIDPTVLSPQAGSAIKMSNHSSDALHICVLNKDELLHTKDAKFAPGTFFNNRGPFLTSALGANFDPRGEVVFQG